MSTSTVRWLKLGPMAHAFGYQIEIAVLIEIGLAVYLQHHLTGDDHAPLFAVGMIGKTHAFIEHKEHDLLLVVLQAIADHAGHGNFDFGKGKDFGRKNLADGLSVGCLHMVLLSFDVAARERADWCTV